MVAGECTIYPTGSGCLGSPQAFIKMSRTWDSFLSFHSFGQHKKKNKEGHKVFYPQK